MVTQKAKRGQGKQKQTVVEAVKEAAQDAVKRLSGSIQGVLATAGDPATIAAEASTQPTSDTPSQLEQPQGYGLLSQDQPHPSMPVIQEADLDATEWPGNTHWPSLHVAKAAQWLVKVWRQSRALQGVAFTVGLLLLILAITSYQAGLVKQAAARAASDLASFRASAAVQLDAAMNTLSLGQQHSTTLTSQLSIHSTQLQELQQQALTLNKHLQELHATIADLSSHQLKMQQRVARVEHSTLTATPSTAVMSQQLPASSQQQPTISRGAAVQVQLEHHTPTAHDATLLRRLHLLLAAVLRRQFAVLPTAQQQLFSTNLPARAGSSWALPLVNNLGLAPPTVTLRVADTSGAWITGVRFRADSPSSAALRTDMPCAMPASVDMDVQVHDTSLTNASTSSQWVSLGTFPISGNLTSQPGSPDSVVDQYHPVAKMSNAMVTRVRLTFSSHNTTRDDTVLCVPRVHLYA